MRWSSPPAEAADGSFQSLRKVPILTLSGSALLQQLEETADRLGLTLKIPERGASRAHRHRDGARRHRRAIMPRLSLTATGTEDLVIMALIEPRMVRQIRLITRHGSPLSRVGSKLARFIRANLPQPPDAQAAAS